MNRGLNALHDLSEKFSACTLCPMLCDSRSFPVFGSGSSSADIVIVGEAPNGEDENESSPFSGESGRLLLQLLADIWPESERLTEILRVKPDKSLDDPNGPFFDALRDYFDDYIFWTNVLLCRPPEGRAPTTQEIKNCKERLQRTIYAVDPQLVIAAGKVAASVLVGKAVGISGKAGTVFDITIPSPTTGSLVRYPMLAIMHPTNLLKQGDQTLYSRKQGDTWATAEALKFGIGLLEESYQDLYQTNFPDRPAGREPK
jgi:DNA polymerase